MLEGDVWKLPFSACVGSPSLDTVSVQRLTHSNEITAEETAVPPANLGLPEQDAEAGIPTASCLSSGSPSTSSRVFLPPCTVSLHHDLLRGVEGKRWRGGPRHLENHEGRRQTDPEFPDVSCPPSRLT